MCLGFSVMEGASMGHIMGMVFKCEEMWQVAGLCVEMKISILQSCLRHSNIVIYNDLCSFYSFFRLSLQANK